MSSFVAFHFELFKRYHHELTLTFLKVVTGTKRDLSEGYRVNMATYL